MLHTRLSCTLLSEVDAETLKNLDLRCTVALCGYKGL